MKKIIPGLTAMGFPNPTLGEDETEVNYLKRAAAWIESVYGFKISVRKNKNDEYALGWCYSMTRGEVFSKEHYGYPTPQQAYSAAIKEFLKYNNKLK